MLLLAEALTWPEAIMGSIIAVCVAVVIIVFLYFMSKD